MEYHELLRKYIDESGLKLDEITYRLKDYNLDITKSYLSQLQNDKVNPASPELNRAIAAITGGDSENLLMAAHLRKAPQEIKDKFAKLVTLKELKNEHERVGRVAEAKAGYYTYERLIQVPVLGCIAAGHPIERIEHAEDIEYVEKSVIRDRPAFALTVKGDSMIGDHIAEGDIVICVEQKEVSPHEIAVVGVNGDEATLKRVKNHDNITWLISSNPLIPPQLLDTDKVEIIGKVIEVRRRLK